MLNLFDIFKHFKGLSFDSTGFQSILLVSVLVDLIIGFPQLANEVKANTYMNQFIIQMSLISLSFKFTKYLQIFQLFQTQ